MKNPLRKKQSPRRRIDRPVGMRVNRSTTLRKPPNEDGKKQRKKSKRKRQIIRVGIATAVLLIGSVVIFQNMRITGVDVVSEQKKYSAAIEQYLDRNPFARAKVFVSAQAIESNLLEEYPEIESAEVTIPVFGNVMSVSIVERQAQLVLKTTDGKFYVVDHSGFAYDTFDTDTANEKTVILTDDTRVEYDLGENRLIPTGLVEFIEETNDHLRTSKYYPDQIFDYRITDEARVIYVQPSGAKYEIKMQLTEPAEEQTQSLFSALEYYESKGIKPVQYVDVRVNGTVYYR